MAQTMIVDQNHEIDHMSQWLPDWYGMDPPTGTSKPNAGMQAMMAMLHGRMPDMDAGMLDLQSMSGSDFETAFLSDMSHHRAMAIMMTGPVLMGGDHAELFTLAENSAISQGEEVKQMDEWLQSWYGIDRPLDRRMMSGSMSMPMSMPTPMPTDMDMDMGH
jgi:uncharacterized protein (DUF305 family)